MDNPDDDKTTINVKAVSGRAWEKAKSSAIKQGETMGTWLSRAINQLADREASGPRELAPLPVNLPPAVNSLATQPRSVLEQLATHPVNLRGETGNPGPANPMSVDDLASLMHGMAALASATEVPPAKTDIRRAYGLADDLVRDARGMPRRPRVAGGKADGKALPETGKAVPLIEETGQARLKSDARLLLPSRRA